MLRWASRVVALPTTLPKTPRSKQEFFAGSYILDSDMMRGIRVRYQPSYRQMRLLPSNCALYDFAGYGDVRSLNQRSVDGAAGHPAFNQLVGLVLVNAREDPMYAHRLDMRANICAFNPTWVEVCLDCRCHTRQQNAIVQRNLFEDGGPACCRGRQEDV